MPVLDKPLHRCHRRRDVQTQLIGSIAIHQHASHKNAQTALFGFFERDMCSLLVRCAEYHCGGRSFVCQSREESRSGGAGYSLIRETLFGGINVVMKPMQQILAELPSAIKLREVDVRIDKPGQDKVSSVLKWERSKMFGKR